MSGRQLEVARWKLDQNATGICFNSTGESIHAYDGRTIYSWHVPAFVEYRRFAVTSQEQHIEGYCRFFQNGNRLLLIASDGGIKEGTYHLSTRELSDLELVCRTSIRLNQYGLLTILLNPDESQLLLRDCAGTSYCIDFPSCREIRPIRFDTSTFASRGSEGHRIYPPVDNELWMICGFDEPNGYREYLAAFDITTGKGLRRRPPHCGDHIERIGLTFEGDALLSIEETAICVSDLETWELYGKIELSPYLRQTWGRSQPAIAFAPNAPLVAVSCECNTRVCISSYEAPARFGVIDFDEEFCVRLLTFSPNGKYLAIASYDVQKEVRVWDVGKLFGI